MPERTIWYSGSLVISWFLNLMLPVLERVLPQIRSSSVVLPAPFGPMITLNSSLSTYSDSLSMALKPSKDTVRSSTARTKSVLLMSAFSPRGSRLLAADAGRQVARFHDHVHAGGNGFDAFGCGRRAGRGRGPRRLCRTP